MTATTQPRSGTVLVLGEDTRSFLAVVRSLGRAGLKVHAAWCSLDAPALRSRYVRCVHSIPFYRPGAEDWREALAELTRRWRYDLVVPCNDGTMLPLQLRRAELHEPWRYYLLSDEAFETCFSKQKTYELAASLGVPLPEQRVVHSAAELEPIAAEFGFPLVLKPRASASLEDPFSRQVVVKAWERAALASALEGFNLAAGVLVQRNFIGVGVGIEGLWRDGEMLAALQHERVHEPLTGGGSTYRRTVPLDPALLQAARRLMAAVRYTGVSMIEFKRNRRTGDWVLIEINPRFWGSLPLSIAAGLDFPRYLYEMLCRGRTEFPQNYRVNLYARNWLMDLYWLKANLTADRRNPALMTAPLGRVALEAANFLVGRERSDTFTLDDPAPAWTELRQFLGERSRWRLRQLGLSRARMRRRARAALAGAGRVLFVCKGNICRSPFAEQVWAGCSEQRECRSAGYYPVEGRPSPAGAVEAALEFGIDLSAHRSRLLEASLAAWADVIFIFDREQEAHFRARYPQALPKLHYVGALEAAGALEIPDPYGGVLAAFPDTYRRLRRLLLEAAPSPR